MICLHSFITHSQYVKQSDDLKSGAVGPWQLDIDDHQTGEGHLVTMSPGDMVFYESARCLHGRPEPLQGEYYVNLFVHYRPVGNPKWYMEDLATAPLDGVQVALQEAIQRNGATLPEGESKHPGNGNGTHPHGTEQGSEGSGTLDRVKHLMVDTKDGVVSGGGKALEATVRARGKFSARVEKHAQKAHKAVSI